MSDWLSNQFELWVQRWLDAPMLAKVVTGLVALVLYAAVLFGALIFDEWLRSAAVSAWEKL